MTVVFLVALGSELDATAVGAPVVFSGVGKVNAAMATVAAIRDYQPRMLINLGTAGGKGLVSKQMYSVDKVVQGDMDASPLGFERFQTPFESGTALELVDLDAGFPFATCYTADRFVTADDYGVASCLFDMECFAIAKVCRDLGVEFHAVKFVTDGGDDEASDDWEANLRTARDNLTSLAQRIIANL